MLNEITKMMDYLGYEKIEIPAYSLTFPADLKSYERQSKTFMYVKNTGKMDYSGKDHVAYYQGAQKDNNAVEVSGVPLNDEFFKKLHETLKESCLKKVKAESIMFLAKAELVSHGIDFLTLTPKDFGLY